jgi:hypothetical protein
MKRIFTFIFFILLISQQNIAQTLQASLGLGSANNRVKIYIESNTTLTTNISTLEFNIAVPVSESISTPTVVSSANSIPWTVDPVHVEGGYNNFAITTSTVPVVFSLTANTEFEVLELEFSDNASILPDSVSLVSLPDGGMNGLYLFLSTGTPQSDGSNLYYSRDVTGENYITSADNHFSYDITGNTSGTTTSTATLIARTTPVKLSSFNATAKNNDALLNWTVENQDATSSYFAIERSNNGTDFNQVGTVNATTNSSASYSYTDNALNLSGTVYYRLKMVDKDGQFAYSDIKTVQFKNAAFAVNLYPNPVQNFTKLTIALDEAQVIKVSVNDALGNIVQQLQITGLKGMNEKTLDLSNVPNGTYMVRIQAGQNSKTLSVVKN